MQSKRCITVPTVNCRPIASEVVFWAIVKDFDFAFEILQKSR